MFDTPWKIRNKLVSWIVIPIVRLVFLVQNIPWNTGWTIYGMPIIQKHRGSQMCFGHGLSLRSTVTSNPLGPNHPVILCTWKPDSVLEVGKNFAMTGGSICAAEKVVIGNNVVVGANCTIVDTDFHPLDPEYRSQHPQESTTAPIIIEDDVFIGMNCLVLKGVTIGHGSVIGAGSVVTKDIPPGVIVGGNPARIIREI
jgi:acetyltransferase-like isoleucine patch superfamily enzyme